MIDVVPDWHCRVGNEWSFVWNLTEDLDRWEPLRAGDPDGVRELVRSDLVPWVSRWPEPALELLRRVLSLGLTTQPELLRPVGEDFWGLLSDAEAFDAVWLPLWEGVFGGEPEVFDPDEINLVRGLEGASLVREMFGDEGVCLPDPVEVWEWYRPAWESGREYQMRAESWVVLFESWDRVQDRRPVEPGATVLVQGRTALDMAVFWARSGEAGLWEPPTDGPIEYDQRVQPLFNDPRLKPFCPPALAATAPPPSISWVGDGPDRAEYVTPRFRPMAELVEGLHDAARALGIAEGDLLSMAGQARGLEVERPSRCQVYLTFAIVAEAVHEALEQTLILRFLPSVDSA